MFSKFTEEHHVSSPLTAQPALPPPGLSVDACDDDDAQRVVCGDRARFKVIITEEYEQADYSRTQLTLMNKAADLMAGRAPAKRGRGVKVEKVGGGDAQSAICIEDFDDISYSKAQLSAMNKADIVAGRREAGAKRPRQVKKITKGRIVMDDGNIFEKSRSPCSTPEAAAGKRRKRLQKPGEINVAEVQQFSREAAGVVMGVTADGTPIGLRVQDPDEELEMV